MKRMYLGYTLVNESGGVKDWYVVGLPGRGTYADVKRAVDDVILFGKQVRGGVAVPKARPVMRASQDKPAPTARGTQKRSKKP